MLTVGGAVNRTVLLVNELHSTNVYSEKCRLTQTVVPDKKKNNMVDRFFAHLLKPFDRYALLQEVGGNTMAGCSPENEQRPHIGFTAPVARELVHRRAVSEVFLTGIQGAGGTAYTLSAQWPRWHVFYGSRNRGFDSALVVETLRQLTILIAHTQLDVPLGMQFLMPEMSVSMASGATPDPSRPAEVTAEVRVSEVRRPGRGLAAFRTTAVFLVDGHRIAEGTATARIVEAGAYSRIRSRRRTAGLHRNVTPVSAAKVGHASSWNVVLGESVATGRWPLRVDVSNPILFDHPLDHVPGVLLIEAVRQALRLALRDPSLDFVTFDARFISIIEFGHEAEVVLESLTADTESVTAALNVQADGEALVRVLAGIPPRPQPSPVSVRGHQPTPVQTGHVGLRESLRA